MLEGRGALQALTTTDYKVQFKRLEIDEYNFFTKTVSELLDGVRLARIGEIITEDNLHLTSSSLRIPPKSQLQQILNLGKSLKLLQEAGVVVTQFDPKVLVKGDKVILLDLIWEIFLAWEFQELISTDLLLKEIESIKPYYTEECEPTEIFNKSEVFSLLFAWCQRICSRYNYSVTNFSSSFSDGKALCYLIHYYHPEILQLDTVHETSVDLLPNWKKRV